MTGSARDVSVGVANPGTKPPEDVKGRVAGANWRYLLPDLRLGHVLCVGVPSLTTLSSLARFGDRVTILVEREAQARRSNLDAAERGLDNVDAISLVGLGSRPVAPLSIDVVLAGGTRTGRRLWSRPAVQADLRRWLKREGLLYAEFESLHDAGYRALLEGFQREFRPLWLAPSSGETRAAAPLNDAKAIAHLMDQGIVRHSHAYRRPFRRRGPTSTQRRLLKRATTRFGALVGGVELDLDRPPAYLRSLARSAGLDVDDDRWGLLASGHYNQKKVLLFLFEGEAESPRYVVKMTRHHAYNERLENEWRALMLLNDKLMRERLTVPQPAFFGVHNSVAVLGQTAITGTPFRRVSTGAADCPHALALLDGLVELGATTTRRPDDSAKVVADLDGLLQQFFRIYQPPSRQRDFLTKQLDVIRYEGTGLTPVFAHGDAGTWNVLVTTEGGVALLDWEAFDDIGMPLWDLFYFMRSYMVLASRSSGTHDALKAFSRYGLGDGALSRLLADVTQRYCDVTGLARRLVEPLFYMCWVHRAIKESFRTAPQKLRRAHYARLVGLCIERRDAPGLDRIFSTVPGG
ncbi:MAG: phosphotransferase family protein [Actinomycetota bacterium]